MSEQGRDKTSSAAIRSITRREFIAVSAAGVAAFASGCGAGQEGDLIIRRAPAEGNIFFDDHQYATVQAMLGRYVPSGDTPGAIEAGAATYVDRLLGAFTFDPPLIYGGGPFSGRKGGHASFGEFLPLSRIQDIGWRTIIEGSQGLPEREFNGPVLGLQQTYRDAVILVNEQAAGRGAQDFASLPPETQDEILTGIEEDNPDLGELLLRHAIAGTYGEPEYGGNRDLVGWNSIGWPGDAQPLGYTVREMAELDSPEDAGALTSDMLSDLAPVIADAVAISGGAKNAGKVHFRMRGDERATSVDPAELPKRVREWLARK